MPPPNTTEHDDPVSSLAAPEVSSLADLIPDPNNARIHSQRNADMLVKSLHEFGAGRSILVDENNVIIAGNGIIEAASEAGFEKVRFIDTDGDTIIAVRRHGLSDDQKARLALVDNRAGELAGWDQEVIAGLLDAGISLEGIWTDKEQEELLRALPLGLEDDDTPLKLTASTPRQDGTEGLDPVTSDNQTSKNGKFINFNGKKIPLTDEEEADLEASLAAYRDLAGANYGFFGMLLDCERRCAGPAPAKERTSTR